MRVILQTLCGCTREWNATSVDGYIPPEIRVAYILPLSSAWVEHKPEDTVDLHYRVFELSHFDGKVNVYREKPLEKTKEHKP